MKRKPDDIYEIKDNMVKDFNNMVHRPTTIEEEAILMIMAKQISIILTLIKQDAAKKILPMLKLMFSDMKKKKAVKK